MGICNQAKLLSPYVARLLLLGRVALVAQRPIVINLSRERSVGRSVCPVHCGKTKTANRIRMPFGIIGRTGPGMRQVVRFGDRSTGRGTFGGDFGALHCNQWGLYGVRVLQRRDPLPKILCADLLLLYTQSTAYRFHGLHFGPDSASL